MSLTVTQLVLFWVDIDSTEQNLVKHKFGKHLLRGQFFVKIKFLFQFRRDTYILMVATVPPRKKNHIKFSIKTDQITFLTKNSKRAPRFKSVFGDFFAHFIDSGEIHRKILELTHHVGIY